MLVTKEFTFEAAHNLLNYSGKCERLHGHTYRLLVTVNYPVGENGLAYDFTDLKRIVKEKVVDRVDHTYLNDLLTQSSVEYLAIWVWNQLSEMNLEEIKIYETPTSHVTYRGEEQHLLKKAVKKTSSPSTP